MKKLLFIGAPMRVFLLIMASVLLLGIWLTGFATAHWLLYLPPAFFTFAAVTGICPGMMFTRTMFKGGKSA
ncbi:MAG TPA: hypothetical protein ENG78_03535 [Acidiferrobacteraceae bacterium]|jgi:hypothetical protein|nr:hypothetical protein [Acidiferrobacteraceae bacterium]HEX19875.1 hypothetical protein [Acidiferrobacteraceae bacterium]